ncbi:hypothetical protein [Mariluticola halotolerans]|uniref:hypothetical protein n=1 Tax=Mariluticola halotolerans TaxID=2909283 RepID=UPI0026E42C23|nr:hypothetical protein [Mariluticola halotolerans]UJQ94458.1 hypothetical protein L1P08_00240 [Mariluticola halotolerans]
MFEKPSLMLRIAVGKSVGFIFGLIAFFALPMMGEPDLMFRLGIALWLIITGAMIGLMGVVTYHPLLHMPLPWWVRGPLIGMSTMLTLWLVAHERIDAIVINMFGPDTILSSGAWIIADGLVIGLVMAWLATLLAGEGRETAGR